MEKLNLYKRKNIDTLIANRFNLDNILLKTESNILQNYKDKHNQSIYEKMKHFKLRMGIILNLLIIVWQNIIISDTKT